MVDQQNLDKLREGDSGSWNEWREKQPDIIPDLRNANLVGVDCHEFNLRKVDLSGATLVVANLVGADLSEANLSNADLSGTDLRRAKLAAANLFSATLIGADLSNADMREADLGEAEASNATLNHALLNNALLTKTNLRMAVLQEAVLIGANLRLSTLSGADLSRAKLDAANLEAADLRDAIFHEAELREAYLRETDLSRADFSQADLSNADLIAANLIETNLTSANLTGCFVYGISAWNLRLEQATQVNLVITFRDEPVITVDNLEVAQFIHLLLNNNKIRDVINTVTSKVVLILGRFSLERKEVLNAIRDELRDKYNLLPILFDFDKQAQRNFTETVRTLAHMAQFIIADITDPSSIPQELQAIVPDLAVPVQPLLHYSQKEKAYAMFSDFSRYRWMLPIRLYGDRTNLLASLEEYVILPAKKKTIELAAEQARILEEQARSLEEQARSLDGQ